MKICTGTNHRNTGYSGEDSAPYLVFSLGTERKVSGTVFNDTVKTSNLDEEKILGDGRYNKDKADDDYDKDYPVQNVKVELMPGNTEYNYQSAQEETTPALIYYTSKDDSTKSGVPAVTTTDENGNFTISGINPGIYYLKFTYPNGDTKIMDSNGTVVNVNDYKSTVVKSKTVRKQLLASTDSKDGEKANEEVQLDTG